MDYRGKKSGQLVTSGGGGVMVPFCDQNIEQLLEYHRKKIPLMPHQIVFMRKNGINIGSEAMMDRIARNAHIINEARPS